MRQWPDAPETMCDQHLLGEHVEHHMIVGSLAKGRSIRGFVETGLINPASLAHRHDAIAQEMTRRGMNHKSPLVVPDVDLPTAPLRSVGELAQRCERCRDH